MVLVPVPRLSALPTVLAIIVAGLLASPAHAYPVYDPDGRSAPQLQTIGTSQRVGNALMGAAHRRTVRVERAGDRSSVQDRSRFSFTVFGRNINAGGLEHNVRAQGLHGPNASVDSDLKLRLRDLVIPLHGKIHKNFHLFPLFHMQFLIGFVPVNTSVEVVVALRLMAHDITRVISDGPLGTGLALGVAFGGEAFAGVGIHMARAGLFAHLDLITLELPLATRFSRDLTEVIPEVVIGSRIELILGAEAHGPFGIGFKVGRSIMEYWFAKRSLPIGRALLHDTHDGGHGS